MGRPPENRKNLLPKPANEKGFIADTSVKRNEFRLSGRVGNDRLALRKGRNGPKSVGTNHSNQAARGGFAGASFASEVSVHVGQDFALVDFVTQNPYDK